VMLTATAFIGDVDGGQNHSIRPGEPPDTSGARIHQELITMGRTKGQKIPGLKRMPKKEGGYFDDLPDERRRTSEQNSSRSWCSLGVLLVTGQTDRRVRRTLRLVAFPAALRFLLNVSLGSAICRNVNLLSILNNHGHTVSPPIPNCS